MRLLVAVVVMVGGCGGAAVGVAQAPDVVQIAPFCVFDVNAPTVKAGEIAYDRRPAHTDCNPPEYGEVLSLGFAADGWWLQLDAVRAQLAIGEPVRFETTDQVALLAMGCTNWIGELLVVSDLPAWSVFIDTTCADDATVHVGGQWSGPGY